MMHKTAAQLRLSFAAVWIAILSMSLLSGCTSMRPVHEAASTPLGDTLPAKYYHVRIPTHDGIELTATVFQPELQPGQTAPLLLQNHGVAGFRTPRPFSIYGKLVVTGKTAIRAWENGYWVISYDQRGYGSSDGKVMMHPEYEVRDVSSVIDWALEHLPRITREGAYDAKIGGLGESWGGGALIMASIEDDRIDAIAPFSAWHNLSEAIAPNGLLKTKWATVLGSTATFNTFFDFGIFFSKPFMTSLNGQMNDELHKILYTHSPAAYCDEGYGSNADVLFVHGFKDTAFNMNQALQNKACFDKHGTDNRIVGVQGGHLLLAQQKLGFPYYHVEGEVHCGSKRFDTRDIVITWFDEKLKGDVGAADVIPEYCFTQNKKEGLKFSKLATDHNRYAIPLTKVAPGVTGMLEMILRPLNALANLPVADNDDIQVEDVEATGGTFRPSFVPLHVASEDSALAGVPTIDVSLRALTHNPVVFAAIGVKQSATGNVEIVSDQVIPLSRVGYASYEMPAVSHTLKKGDIVGLVLTGSYNQYALNSTYRPTNASLEGEIRLPLVTSQAFRVASN